MSLKKYLILLRSLEGLEERFNIKLTLLVYRTTYLQLYTIKVATAKNGQMGLLYL